MQEPDSWNVIISFHGDIIKGNSNCIEILTMDMILQQLYRT